MFLEEEPFHKRMFATNRVLLCDREFYRKNVRFRNVKLGSKEWDVRMKHDRFDENQKYIITRNFFHDKRVSFRWIPTKIIYEDGTRETECLRSLLIDREELLRRN